MINFILKSIKGGSERNPAIAKLFDGFSELLGDRSYDEAERILDIIDGARDGMRRGMAAGRVKLRLERSREVACLHECYPLKKAPPARVGLSIYTRGQKDLPLVVLCRGICRGSNDSPSANLKSL